ncbi:MAG: hypothetical protein JXQ29_10135 [Planctomycetes bacterium]|nr:hypothetical protein [Planctomycetota bacterium]
MIGRGKRKGPETLRIKVGGQLYFLQRLSDGEYVELCDRCIAVKHDRLFGFELSCSSRLSLAETYAILKRLFGERSRMFDEWKGDFSFPLALGVARTRRWPAYMLRVVNIRDYVDYQLSRVVGDSDPRVEEPYYFPPDEAEFSCEEINQFLAYFAGYLEGRFEAVGGGWDEPFLLHVGSNSILYGFDGKRFFDEHCDGQKDFDRKHAKLAKRLPRPGFYGPVLRPRAFGEDDEEGP